MRIENPCDWVIERLKSYTPFFSVRINDGEMICMYRTRPEGSLLGTDKNPAYTNYQLGDELVRMVVDMGELTTEAAKNVLIGCSWGTSRADYLCDHFNVDVEALKIKDLTWCNEHWPLDGVIDGSTIRMIEAIRERHAVLITCPQLCSSALCLDAYVVRCSKGDSWKYREWPYEMCKVKAAKGHTVFIWAGGIGLKPTAWRLYKEFPTSSHIDVGHLFNGAMWLRDYGWLQRQDGPWYKPYFEKFVPYVRSFIP